MLGFSPIAASPLADIGQAGILFLPVPVRGTGVVSETTLTQTHALTGDAVLGAAIISDATLTQNHVLTGETVLSVAFVPAATLTQSHALNGEPVIGGAFVGTTVLNETVNFGQSLPIIAPALISTTALTQNHAFAPAPVRAEAFVDDAALLQKHILQGEDVQSGPAFVSAPDFARLVQFGGAIIRAGSSVSTPLYNIGLRSAVYPGGSINKAFSSLISSVNVAVQDGASENIAESSDPDGTVNIARPT